MNLRQIETFIHVAEPGSLRKSVVMLDVAQPALSRRVRALAQPGAAGDDSDHALAGRTVVPDRPGGGAGSPPARRSDRGGTAATRVPPRGYIFRKLTETQVAPPV